MAASAVFGIGSQVQVASSARNARRAAVGPSGSPNSRVALAKLPSLWDCQGRRDQWRSICRGVSGTAKVEELTSGGGPGDGKGSGGGDGGGEGDNGAGGEGHGGLNPGIVAILAETGREVSSFPADFSKALLDGKVTEGILKRYLSLEKNIITGFLMGLAGFRQRLLADPGFLFKVGIECGIGIFTKTTAEYKKREEVFFHELDFVLANVIMALLADFCLVWLPAPTLRFSGAVQKARVTPKWMQNIPENAFQVVRSGTTPFTPLQRACSILKNGSKLFGVGVVCSAFGVAMTNGLIWTREKLDPNFKKAHPAQDVPLMAAAYGVYMGVSSNIRYQILAGVLEERGIDRLLPHGTPVNNALTFVLRTANTYLGSLLWVDFLRITGLQKKTAVKEDTGDKKTKKQKKKN